MKNIPSPNHKKQFNAFIKRCEEYIKIKGQEPFVVLFTATNLRAIELNRLSKALSNRAFSTQQIEDEIERQESYCDIFGDHSILMHFRFYLIKDRGDEIYLQSHFLKNCSKYIPDSKNIKFARIGKRIPDGMLEIKGKKAVVEVKRSIFDRAALKQLQGYMKDYNTEIGVAVAGRASFKKFPDNIIYVEIDADEIKS